jgi:hypothetical protein
MPNRHLFFVLEKGFCGGREQYLDESAAYIRRITIIGFVDLIGRNHALRGFDGPIIVGINAHPTSLRV